ncbi:hypothetical protein Hanom_Chr04g00370501 [Helianthus anomalus]
MNYNLTQIYSLFKIQFALGLYNSSNLAIIVGQNVILESSSYKALFDSLHAIVKHL